MAEIWGAAIIAAGAVYSAREQAGAAKDAAGAAKAGTDATIAEQRRQYDLTRQDQMPWMQAGGNALGQMEALNSGDFSSFTESPDYQFAMSQGLQGLDRSAAARGGLLAGGHSADVMQFAGGLASQNYSDYYNRLAGLAGVGQTTASGLGGLGAAMAGSVGNAHMANADAQRQSSYDRANANSQLAGSLTGLASGYFNNRQPQTQQQQPFAYQPQQGGWQSSGTLGPSNGSSWNFGG